MGSVKFLNRRFGLGGGLFNHFDGSIDLLDDLDDHYTARTHKKERAELMVQLQQVAADFSVRITILGGDVHLAALGRFYSNPDLQIPAEEDHRYMVNVISSAIVNEPPPQAVANLLARRNKIHHMNHKTDETLLNLFNKDPGDSNKTANHNHCTMPAATLQLSRRIPPTVRVPTVVPRLPWTARRRRSWATMGTAFFTRARSGRVRLIKQQRWGLTELATTARWMCVSTSRPTSTTRKGGRRCTV